MECEFIFFHRERNKYTNEPTGVINADFNGVSLKGKRIIVLGDLLEDGEYFYEIAKRIRREEPSCHPKLRVAHAIQKDGIFKVASIYGSIDITNSYYDSSWSQYEEVASLNNIVVHENPYYIPLGILFDDSISEWTNSNIIEDYDNIIDYYNAFSNSLGCGDVFNEISIAQTEEEITEDSTYCLADLSQLVDGQGTVPIQVHVSPSVGGTLYIYDEYSLIYLGEAEEGKNDVIEISITLTEDYNNFTVNLVSVNEESIKNLYEKLSKSNMTNIEYGSTYLSGDFEASHDGTLYLSLPNFSGFTAYVDGVKTECKDYLGGIGLDMTTGAHHIELKYTPPGLIPGAVLSGISIIIFIVYLIIRKKINRNQKQLEKTVEN